MKNSYLIRTNLGSVTTKSKPHFNHPYFSKDRNLELGVPTDDIESCEIETSYMRVTKKEVESETGWHDKITIIENIEWYKVFKEGIDNPIEKDCITREKQAVDNYFNSKNTLIMLDRILERALNSPSNEPCSSSARRLCHSRHYSDIENILPIKSVCAHDADTKNIDELNIKYTKSIYEGMGIKIVNKYDDLFYNVILPDGWKFEELGYLTCLYDNKNRMRGSFSKAWLPNRSNTIEFTTRLRVFIDFANRDYRTNVITNFAEMIATPHALYIKACGEKTIKLLEETPKSSSAEYFNMQRDLIAKGESYLDEHYPNWRDPLAYWDK